MAKSAVARVRPPIHVLSYADSGAGKSTFAATFPKPLLVFSWDPLGKETPYLKQGTVLPMSVLDDGSPLQLVDCPDGQIQIEHYIDEDPRVPDAWPRFLARMAGFRKDYAEWATVVIDSLTFMELAARKFSQYILKPKTKEPRQWFGDSTDSLEEMVMQSFGSFHLNVVICAHIDEDKDEVNGVIIRNPSAPGRLRKRLSSAYSEMYHNYVGRNEKGEREYWLQTRSDRMHNAATQIDAPDPCYPHYDYLWENWK